MASSVTRRCEPVHTRMPHVPRGGGACPHIDAVRYRYVYSIVVKRKLLSICFRALEILFVLYALHYS